MHYLVLFQAFNQATYAGTRFLIALYAVHQQASPFVVGLLVALFSLAPTFLTVPAGRLIDRIGTRVPLQVSHVAMLVSLLLACLWPRMEFLYVAAAVIGAGFFVVQVGSTTLISRHGLPGERAVNFSRAATGVAVAQGLAPMVMGFTVGPLGYTAAFVVATLFAALTWGVFVLGRLKHLEPARQPAGGRTGRGGAMDMLRDPRLRAVFLVSTMFIAGWDIFLVMTPIHGHRLGMSESQIGMLMGAFSLAAFVSRATGAWLSRRYTTWQLLLLALVVQGCGTILFGLVAVVPLLLAFSFIAGLGYGVCGPMSNTALYDVAPPERVNEAVALRMSLGMAAQSVLPLMIGSAGSFIPAGPLFWAAGLVLLATAVAQRRQWTAGR